MFKRLTHRYLAAFIGYGLVAVGSVYTLLITQPLWPTWQIFAVAALSVLLVGAALAWWLARNITQLVAHMLVMLEALDRGEAVEKLKVSRKDELAEFAHALNRMSNRDKAVEQANQDPLTGLPNRRFLLQKMTTAFEAKRDMGAMFIDLDGFKPINDKHGHEMGDEALKAVAERFSACIRERDVLSRIGGDEFVMVFMGTNSRETLEERANKVLELINEPIWIGDTRLKMGASIGIAITPDDGKDAEDLLNSADEAMYAAKKGGKNAFRFYS